MSDDKHYVLGDFYRIDDRSGFKRRNWQTRKEWNGLIVDRNFWEERQPQDFVKGVTDNQNVPEARPRQVDVFIAMLQTTTTADVGTLGTTIPIVSSVRMFIGDTVQIMLDNGVMFTSKIASVPTLASITINPGLPSIASSGSILNDLTAYSSPSIG